MRKYSASFAVGILAGVIYGLIGQPSPAPPTVALVGLLGILLGEQVIHLCRHVMSGEAVAIAWRKRGCIPRRFRAMPSERTTTRDQQVVKDAREPPSAEL